ncbi:unnamed protein product [Vitrella brassicaformis CCMP3155]|uniref:Spindle pole body component n=1 Tax=Vitrella brassicaformis (strain CCMP3155) TaxID=1169540 RepID=A0A0G4EA12_VITBC|nr:unnamed protein product [Vitrella brassicaformis CCMP3155]|eukprot:CEL92290.1 unnamed protein product [Vitrella brassicaformis CCMP3155]
MISEVLFAVVGVPGDLIQLEGECFVVNPAVKSLAKGESELIGSIVATGADVAALKSFVTAATQASEENQHAADQVYPWLCVKGNGVSPTGLYVQALARQIGAYLREYHRKVCDLEQQYLEDPLLPFSHISVALQHQPHAIRTLRSLAQQVCWSDRGAATSSTGAALLDTIWDGWWTAPSPCRPLLASVLSGVGEVLLYQLVTWVVRGELVDPHGEFFVRCCRDKGGSGGDGDGGMVADGNGEMIGKECGRYEWNDMFGLRYDAIPSASCVSIATAKKVLFIGKAVRVLRRSGLWRHTDMRDIQPTLDKMRDVFAVAVKGEMTPVAVLEDTVETLRAAVAHRLWRLLHAAGLVEHIKALKTFYLLGGGFFFQVLLDEAWPLLSSPPDDSTTPTSMQDSLQRVAWHRAARAVADDADGGGACAHTAPTQTQTQTQTETDAAAAAAAGTGVVNPLSSHVEHFSVRLMSNGFEVSASMRGLSSVPLLMAGRTRLSDDGTIVLGEPSLIQASPASVFFNRDNVPMDQGSSACWHLHRQPAAHGFKHTLNIRLFEPTPPPPTGSPKHQQPPSIPSARLRMGGTRVAIVFQNRTPPSALHRSTTTTSRRDSKETTAATSSSSTPVLWPAMPECVVVEAAVRLMQFPHGSSDAPTGGGGGSRRLSVDMAAYLISAAMPSPSTKRDDAAVSFLRAAEVRDALWQTRVVAGADGGGGVGERRGNGDGEGEDNHQRGGRGVHRLGGKGKVTALAVEAHAQDGSSELSVECQIRVAYEVGSGERGGHLVVHFDAMHSASDAAAQDDQDPLLRIPINLSSVLSLDLGSLFVGLMTLPLSFEPPGHPSPTTTSNSTLLNGRPSQPATKLRLVTQQQQQQQQHPNAASFTTQDWPFEVRVWRHEGCAEAAVAGSGSSGTTSISSRGPGGALRGGAHRQHTPSWQDVRLHYSPPWPIPLVISDANIESYNALFSFLLALRKAQYELELVWKDGSVVRRLLPHGSSSSSSSSAGPATEDRSRSHTQGRDRWTPVWLLRCRMSYIVSQVLQYLQQDVIEEEYLGLLHRIEHSQDFEDIKRAHDTFLAVLMTRCFLRLSVVHRAILELVDAVRRFTEAVHTHAHTLAEAHADRDEDSNGSSSSSKSWANFQSRIHMMESSFDRWLCLLFQELSSCHQEQSVAVANNTLAQLLLRLDYNGYLSASIQRPQRPPPTATPPSYPLMHTKQTPSPPPPLHPQPPPPPAHTQPQPVPPTLSMQHGVGVGVVDHLLSAEQRREMVRRYERQVRLATPAER